MAGPSSGVGRWLRAGGLQWRQPGAQAMGGLVSSPTPETIPGSALRFSLLQFSTITQRWRHQPDPTHRLGSGDKGSTRDGPLTVPETSWLSLFTFLAPYSFLGMSPPGPSVLNPNFFQCWQELFSISCHDYTSYSVGSRLTTSVNLTSIAISILIPL